MVNLDLENYLIKRGYKSIAGTDEAGRGPLAGPVVAACVLYNPLAPVEDLQKIIKDSKSLSLEKREVMFNDIKKRFKVGIGVCDNNTIDRLNILQATFLAMKKAVSDLKEQVDYLLVDGQLEIPNCSRRQKAIIKGDEKIFSIMAASIVAKVTRDRIMAESHQKFPLYRFDLHKGYGTKLHMEQIKKHGICEIHRKSFGPCKI
jgi:ribonuclease HII